MAALEVTEAGTEAGTEVDSMVTQVRTHLDCHQVEEEDYHLVHDPEDDSCCTCLDSMLHG
jgi:hypothetical protein